MTHPYSTKLPAALERRVKLAPGQPATLRFAVAAHEKGDWQLRVRVDGAPIHESMVNATSGPRWRDVSVDLSKFAGREIVLRVENAANDWAYEFGYWSGLRIDVGTVAAK